jgi:hypothetical protein
MDYYHHIAIAVYVLRGRRANTIFELRAQTANSANPALSGANRRPLRVIDA